MKFINIIKFVPIAGFLLCVSAGCGSSYGSSLPSSLKVSCAETSFASGTENSCVATLNTAAPSDAQLFIYGVSGPISLVTPQPIYFSGKTATFYFVAGSVTANTPATFVANAYSKSVTVKLTVTPRVSPPPTGSLSDSASSVAFGNVDLQIPTSKTVVLTSTGTASVTIASVSATGTGFSVSGVANGTVMAPNATATLTITFNPTVAGAATGSVVVVSNVPSLTITLSGTGVSTTAPPALTIVSCNTPAITGAGSDACQVDLSGPATVATAITLSSSSGSLTVPSSVTVPVGASSASFTATARAVTTTTIATVTAVQGGNTATTTVTLNPVVAAPTLTAVSCTASTITGAGTNACSVTLSAATASATAVSLSSNNSSLTVPASVTVSSGTSSAAFTATAAAVTTATATTLTATLASVSKTFSLELEPATTGCSAFGPVDVFLNMNGQSPGATVTTANLDVATEGNGTWSTSTSAETFASSQVALPASISINGGTVHGCGYATQSLAINEADSQPTSEIDFPTGHTQVVVSGWIANLPPNQGGAGDLYDYVVTVGANVNAGGVV